MTPDSHSWRLIAYWGPYRIDQCTRCRVLRYTDLWTGRTRIER